MITLADIRNVPVTATWTEMLRIAFGLAVEQRTGIVLIKPGIEVPPETMAGLIERAATMICAPTVIDAKNPRLELTHTLAAGFPDMKYQMGTHDPSTGAVPVNCFDHGIIAAPCSALLEVGNFDPGFIEYLTICDWTVRARWHGLSVHLCHDLTVSAPNLLPFTAVYRDREAEMALLDRTHFERKWGGAVLRNVTE